MHWLLAFPVLAFGAAVLLVNLSVAAACIRDCLRRGRFRRRSGLPFLGPLLVSLGLGLSPLPVRPWMIWGPWALDLAAFVAALAVLRATRSRPA